jgi:hypothetical protein
MMRKLRVGILDITTKAPTRALYARVMNANLASIMPQVVGVWCEQLGHRVTYVCYTGFEDLKKELPDNVDIIFIGAFTEAAHMAYALSNYYRSRGAVTVLGGPHARCYPQDAATYFDYVLGFTDKRTIEDVLLDCVPHQPLGLLMAAPQQPAELPGVRERWKFIAATLKKAPTIKIVPMLASLGCPYACSFCIDSEITYQPLNTLRMQEDLKFLLSKFKRPRVGWHDPNFGIRFDDCMDAIEEVVPPDRIDFIAESSLSLLSEAHLKRLRRNGFKAILPGIESWYEMGNKSKSGANKGLDKVRQVSEHVNLVMRYIPYVQTNFVLGMDLDEGAEPFELTKKFIDLTPGAFPAYSLLTAFGQAAPLNLAYQRDNRLLPFPFHFLNNNHAMNVKPKNYEWPDFYDKLSDLTHYTYSWQRIYRRFRAVKPPIPKWMNVVRAVSTEGWGRLKFYRKIRRMLSVDTKVRDYFEARSSELPEFYTALIKRDLGEFWEWLPEGAMFHDPYAYLKAYNSKNTAQIARTP